MSAIEIRGMCPIKGEIEVQGSKNAVLPIMAASVLNHGITVIENVPGIQDVFCMMGILDSLGCRCTLTGHSLEIDARQITNTSVCRNEMEKMRSSIMLLGVLLGRAGEACVYAPGGCMIGKRPIDLHLMALEKLGVQVMDIDEDGCLAARAPSLKGAVIHLPYPSVGATENALFAAVAAEGHTSLTGCAMEPEIEELCHFLNNMGARIRGVGTDCLAIEGGLPLHDSRFRVGGDRIVAGTYLCAAAGAGGEVLITGISPRHLTNLTDCLKQMGASIYQEDELLYLKVARELETTRIKTGPYPEFPTDLQPMMMVVMSQIKGMSVIEETVFENRYKVVKELVKLRADIEIEDKKAYIYGKRKLYGASAEAMDLRGGAALVCAGLVAEDITRVTGYEYIKRGYEDICADLRSLGADVRQLLR